MRGYPRFAGPPDRTVTAQGVPPLVEPFHAIAVLITLAAVFAYLNHHFLKMPMTIGLMFMSLVVSLSLIFLDRFGLPVGDQVAKMIGDLDFSHLLLDGMLGLLLFAGALHVNLNDLLDRRLEITVFATIGVIASTVLVGTAVYYLSLALDLGLRYVDSLLFGALISPTDPIAVLGILKKAGASRSLEIKIAGESLFNDGIGVVVFLLLLEIATGDPDATVGHALTLFAKEALGGAAFGLIIGYIAYRLLKSMDEHRVELMITLALVTGGYTLAGVLHISAPIAIVLAGLLIGNQGRRLAMSDTTRENLDTFWELVDAILNAVLFVLIGLEVMVLALTGKYILAGLIAIPITLLARFISVGLPISLMRGFRTFSPRSVRVMTWGGLRGGISVALALSLCSQCNRELILTMTYVVVVFSVLVQGLTIKRVVQGRK
jgi:CPA1 family monovalent cation:H+ antiporter